MNGVKITEEEIKQIVYLRQRGHSLPEIRKIVNRGSSTVFKYVKEVNILPEFQEFWRNKRKASTWKHLKEWERAKKEAATIIQDITKREKILIAASLYWAEGNKKGDFSLSNTDPFLIKSFVECLKGFGIGENNLSLSIRVFSDLEKEKAIVFWCKVTGLSREKVKYITVLDGKKKGKLEYGMCRIRVIRGGYFLKLITEIKNCIIKELAE